MRHQFLSAADRMVLERNLRTIANFPVPQQLALPVKRNVSKNTFFRAHEQIQTNLLHIIFWECTDI